MSISVYEFGKMPSGEKISEYVISNGMLSVSVLNLGGIIKNIKVKNKREREYDVVLGFDTVEEYLHDPNYVGKIVGRNCNRISNASVKIGEKTYNLPKNESPNNLHSGGFLVSNEVFSVKPFKKDDSVLLLTYHDKEKESGLPGDMDITYRYEVVEEGCFRFSIEAVSNKDTIANFTNHAYFNISGHSKGTLNKIDAKINSSHFFPVDAQMIPKGELRNVEGTAFDFRKEKPITEEIDDCDCVMQLRICGGYDHCYKIDGEGLRTFAEFTSEETGIKMELRADTEAMQFYTSNAFVEYKGKNNAKYKKRGAFCIEPSFVVDAMNMEGDIAKKPLLKANEPYKYTSEYVFYV